MGRAANDDGAIAIRVIAAAWLVTSVYYFYQYVLRSAPAVMMPQLGDAFGLTPVGVASLLGLFYYAYAPFSFESASRSNVPHHIEDRGRWGKRASYQPAQQTGPAARRRDDPAEKKARLANS